jgi:antirestriction protein ArdC
LAPRSSCTKAGLQSEDVHDNSAAYLASWLAALKGDNKLVFHAASKAQRAVDYITGTEPYDPRREPYGE